MVEGECARCGLGAEKKRGAVQVDEVEAIDDDAVEEVEVDLASGLSDRIVSVETSDSGSSVTANSVGREAIPALAAIMLRRGEAVWGKKGGPGWKGSRFKSRWPEGVYLFELKSEARPALVVEWLVTEGEDMSTTVWAEVAS